MRTIGITIETVHRMYHEIEITDEQFEALKSDCLSDIIGEEAMNELYEKTESSGDYSMDYAITDEDGVTIIDWE